MNATRGGVDTNLDRGTVACWGADSTGESVLTIVGVQNRECDPAMPVGEEVKNCDIWFFTGRPGRERDRPFSTRESGASSWEQRSRR